MTHKIKVVAEYRTMLQFDADGTESLEQLEDNAWEIFGQIELSELDWDVAVSKYTDKETH